MVIGTLRQQLLYPHNDTTVTEEQLIEMLKFVKLGEPLSLLVWLSGRRDATRAPQVTAVAIIM